MMNNRATSSCCSGLSTRVLDLGDTPRANGGSYPEYVESTGFESPGVHA